MYHSCVESSLLLCPEPEEGFTSSGLQQKHQTLPSTENFKTTSSQTAQARLQRRHPHTQSLGTHSGAETHSFKYCTYDPRVEGRNMCFPIEFSVATDWFLSAAAAHGKKPHHLLKIHLNVSNNRFEATGTLYKHFITKREIQINSNKDERRQKSFLSQLPRKYLIGGFFLSWVPEGLLIVSSAWTLLWHVRPGSL